MFREEAAPPIDPPAAFQRQLLDPASAARRFLREGYDMGLPDRNVPGPFYVDADCCIICGIPIVIAPEVFAWDDSVPNGPCYVKAQPGSEAAFENVIEAMKCAEMDCIRFRGRNDAWRRRLVAEGFAKQCDDVPEEGEG